MISVNLSVDENFYKIIVFLIRLEKIGVSGIQICRQLINHAISFEVQYVVVQFK